MSMQRPVGLVVSLVVVVLVAVLGWVLVPGGQSASPDTTPHRDVADEAEQSAAEEPAPVEAPTGETVMVSQERQAFEPGRLLVGDPAPALSIKRWYLGEPRERLTPGYVHVVDLWATWCGPCVRAMPELTALQAEYRNKGVRVLGVSIDEARNAEEQVERFIENRSDTIGFDIALDDGRTVQDWLTAAGRSSIPTSYVVDQEGTVAWIGHPQATDPATGEPVMLTVIEGLLEGTYDLEGAAAEARKEILQEREQAQAAERVAGLMEEMNEAWASGDREKTMEIIDQVIEKSPDTAAELAVRKAEILLYELNRGADASAFVGAMIEGPYSEDSETLMRFSSLLSGDLDPGPHGRRAAVDAASRAVELIGDEPNALAQLGHAQFVAGDVQDAIDTMIRARDLCPEDSGMYEVLNDLVGEYQRSSD